MKKSPVLTLLIIPALALCLVALPGCGKSAEEAIREELTGRLEELKGGASKDFVEMMESGANEAYAELGLDTGEYAKAFLEGFDYEVGDIELNDAKDAAEAEVTVIIKSPADIVARFGEEFAAALGELDALPSEEGLLQLGTDAMLTATEKAEAKAIDVELPFELEDGKWVAAGEGFTEDLAVALLGE